jgi:hypothetical protein
VNEKIKLIYRKLTDACQTKASNKKRTGIMGKTSTIGSKTAYASGSLPKIIIQKIIKKVKLQIFKIRF